MTSLAAFILGSKTITSALGDVTLTEGTSASGQSQAFWDGLLGLNALTVVADLKTVAASGTTAQLTVDTMLGSNGLWIPIMRFDFATTQLTKWMTAVRAAQASSATIASLSADTAINLLGQAFRSRLTTTGIYPAGTLLTITAQPSI